MSTYCLQINLKRDKKTLNDLCVKSKLIYNKANYIIKQQFIIDNKWLRYNNLYHVFKNNEKDLFNSLPTDTTRQILMLLDRNWKSFFQANKVYKKAKNKFLSRPKPPKYKEKHFILIFNGQNQTRIKNNQLLLPKRTLLSSIGLPKNFNYKVNQVRIIPTGTGFKGEILYEKDDKIQSTLDMNKFISIDLGVNNLATITSNQNGFKPILINGRWLKSINRLYSKNIGELKSKLNNKQRSSKQILRLTQKRNNQIKWFMHNVSKYIVDLCSKNNIGNIVIGINRKWKDGINIGKTNNQNVCLISHDSLIKQVNYKASRIGVKVIETEERYTSKCSSLDLEPIKKHEEYMGKRVHRGLFKGTNFWLNADVNGSLNIARKVFNDGFLSLIDRGCVTQPYRINPVKIEQLKNINVN